jgi:general secretion pathway protein J
VKRIRHRAAAGFTLIELLVALLILGVMSALGYGSYRSARISSERAEESMQRTRQIEFGLRTMVQDFAEAVPRPIRDPLGNSSTRQPAMRGSVGGQTLVDITRAGWSNTAGVQRSTLQRVSYQLVGTTLERSHQVVLDPTSQSQPVIEDLLTGVKSVTLNYMDASQAWQTQWPPPSISYPENQTIRPIAVEIIIEFNDWGRVRRLVEVAG